MTFGVWYDFALDVSRLVDSYSDICGHLSTARDLRTKDSVTPEEFMSFWELMLYDHHTRRRDIRVSKVVEYEGVIVIRNHKRKELYVIPTHKVMKKLSKIFRGYEYPEIYGAWERRNRMTIRVYPLTDSSCETIGDLKRQLYDLGKLSRRGYNRVAVSR